MSQALVLFAHGSRDPLWREPMEAVAVRVRELAPGLQVVCAYLELTEPDLPKVTSQLIAAGVIDVWVRPMFLGAGRHAREDLPRLVDALRERYPWVKFHLQASMGEEAQILDSLARVALTGMAA